MGGNDHNPAEEGTVESRPIFVVRITFDPATQDVGLEGKGMTPAFMYGLLAIGCELARRGVLATLENAEQRISPATMLPWIRGRGQQ